MGNPTHVLQLSAEGIAEPTVLLPWLNGRSNWVYRVSKRECISILVEKYF